MPGKIKVKVLAGRNLPVMDRASDTTDAFVEIKFGGVTHKTDVCRKSLNPQWNSTEWYRFEVDESELQDEPLQLRLMDHDTYSANDAIGKVVISLAPLLSREPTPTTKGTAAPQTGAMMSGWIPVFDTLHGIRGELNVIVKVELFADFNKYKTSSCGVQFFHCPTVPPGYHATAIHGFVEELVVNDDPEYQWIDKIRTPRASNEARQAAFIKLSNQVQRLVGLKAAELGANAVVGYQQAFDLEGEAGVVARAIGTAISITPLPTPSQPSSAPPCSQQQLKKYLGILTTDNESVTDLNEYFQTHQEELQKLLHILHPKFSSNFLDEQENEDDDEKTFNLTRESSIKSYTDSVSIYQKDHIFQESLRHIAEDQTELNKLLYRDERQDDEASGPLKIIRKMKPGFFSRRFASLRKKSQKLADDQISIKSNSSDTSRISLSDIKNEFRKLRRLKKAKFRHVDPDCDDGIGMASILARSVIHAHTSLARISETQDSEHSPSSTLRKTSESEPTISMPDEDHTKIISDAKPSEDSSSNKTELKPVLPEIHFSSLNNLNIDEEQTLQKKLSESCPNTPMVTRIDNFLKLPGEVGYFDSTSSALSGDSSDLYTTSDEEDESSDLKTDTEKSIETTSSIVQTVLKHKVDPVFIEQMEKKLSEFKGSPELKTEQSHDSLYDDESHENSPLSDDDVGKSIDKIETHEKYDPAKSKNTHHHHFKFLNPFSHKKAAKSLSEPSSPVDKKQNFVYRSSKRLKRQISKISKSSMIKSISHYSLIPKKKHNSAIKSHHSSGSDVPSKAYSKETVLGSSFLSYTDLLSLDKEGGDTFITPEKHYIRDHNPKVHMYIGSEPASRASFSCPASPRILDHKDESHSFHIVKPKIEKSEMKPTGLLHTAMETILMDKVQSLLIPTSPEPKHEGDKRFFENVNAKLDEMKSKEYQSHDSENVSSKDTHKKLVRQNSIHSLSENVDVDPSVDTSKEIKTVDHKSNVHHQTKPKPVLQHLHPIMSGPIHPKVTHLETIPSLPESFDREISIDKENEIPMSASKEPANIENDELSNSASELNNLKDIEVHNVVLVDRQSDGLETNIKCPLEDSVVCDNSHAACGGRVRRERGEKDREREKCDKDRGSPRHARHESYGGRDPAPTTTQINTSLNATSAPVGMHRRSSDSDLSVTPKGSSLNTSVGNTGTGGGGAILKPSMNSNNIDMLEYPFLTMTEYPAGFIVHLGGTVCARSVKLLDGAAAATGAGGAAGSGGARAAWWAELRTELRAHARALRCHAVLAYAEATAICEDVCVLSASGTAAVINLDCDFDAEVESIGGEFIRKSTEGPETMDSCSVVHAPYASGAVGAGSVGAAGAGAGWSAELGACRSCGRARAPRVLLATTAAPRAARAHAQATTLTAVAARVRRAAPAAEPGARDISDQLPFLEYELHKLLLAKLRMQGANALFNLQTQISMGERCVVALASGTAVRLAALPAPTPPKIKSSESDKEALELQKALWDTFTANKTANGYDVGIYEHAPNGVLPEVDNEDTPVLDLAADKDACILELDESEDVETARSLAVRRRLLPVYTKHPQMRPLPGAKPYAYAQVWRSRFAGGTIAAEKHVARTLDGAQYKLRTLRPCALTPTKFQVELSEDEIQLMVSGAAIPLVDPNNPEHNISENTNSHHNRNGPITFANGNNPQNTMNSSVQGTGDADDDIFTLDEEQPSSKQSLSDIVDDKSMMSNGLVEVQGAVALTPGAALAGAARGRWLCALRLLFVRESTAVRELGGLPGLLHCTLAEILAIVRAHTAALGGNALTSFYITQLMLQDNAHKNQGQCLLSVGGDVVHITY